MENKVVNFKEGVEKIIYRLQEEIDIVKYVRKETLGRIMGFGITDLLFTGAMIICDNWFSYILLLPLSISTFFLGSAIWDFIFKTNDIRKLKNKIKKMNKIIDF